MQLVNIFVTNTLLHMVWDWQWPNLIASMHREGQCALDESICIRKCGNISIKDCMIFYSSKIRLNTFNIFCKRNKLKMYNFIWTFILTGTFMRRCVRKHHHFHGNCLPALFHLHSFTCGMDTIYFCCFGCFSIWPHCIWNYLEDTFHKVNNTIDFCDRSDAKIFNDSMHFWVDNCLFRRAYQMSCLLVDLTLAIGLQFILISLVDY